MHNTLLANYVTRYFSESKVFKTIPHV